MDVSWKVDMYVCLSASGEVGYPLSTVYQGVSHPPPQGITSTQTEAMIQLPPRLSHDNPGGIPRGNYPLPFPAKSHRLRTRLIYCDTRWLVVQAIKDRSQEKPRCSCKRQSVKQAGTTGANRTDRTLLVFLKRLSFIKARGGLRANGRKVDTNRQQVPKDITKSDGL